MIADKDGNWVKPVVIENPETKQRLYHDGQDWKPVPLTSAEEGAGFAASMLQGPLMGTGDEFTAFLENPVETTRSLFTGEKTPGYDASLEKFRGIEERYRQANPGMAFAATAGAGLLGGGYQLGRGAFNLAGRYLPQAAGRVGQAAATGAGFGGVAGFGMGEGGLANRLESAVFGAGTGAAFGAGLEVAAPAIGAIIQRVRGNPRLYDPRAGRLTLEGERVAQEAGLDPAQASAALQREFAAEAQNALDPGQAAFVAQARSLPVGVNPTRGQTTLRPDDQMFETQAAKDVYGNLTGERLRGRFQEQDDALRGNVAAIGQRIGGGQVQELGQGVAQAQARLAAAERASSQNVDNLYTAARAANGSASVGGQQVSQGVFDISQRLSAQGFTPRSAPQVHEILTELQNLTRQSQQRPATNIGEIWARRMELNALARGTPSPQTAAASNARHELDRWITDIVDNGLIQGDDSVVALWRTADRARRAHALNFEADDFVGKLVARTQDGTNQLKLDPQAAVNLIFGRSDSGFTTQNNMVRGLMRLRDRLGADSQAWNALREEAFLRMARTAEGETTPLGRNFSGAKFAKAWEDALAKSPGTMRLLFTEQERNLISQFANIARRVTTNVKGGANNSNTSAGVAQIMRRLFASAFMGPKMAALLEAVPIVKGLQNLGQDIRAQSAILNRIQRGTRPQPTPRLNRAVEYGAGPVASAGAQSRPFDDR